MNEYAIIWFSAGAIVGFLMFLWYAKLIAKKKGRKSSEIPTPQFKHSLKSPTYKFQKYRPCECPHHNGIYRKVKYQVLDKTLEKSIFVCADCVSSIEIDELDHRDKFKGQDGKLLRT